MARIVTATCCQCGTVEQSTHASNRYRCTSCTAAFLCKIQSMADDGLSQSQIATKLGCTQVNISRWCIKAGITTGGAKPRQNVGAVHGIGKPPAKLMPSRQALGLVSVFDLAHASIEKNFARFENPNHP